MAQLLYHVGRWIYLIDAWNDREEDAAAGRYNPVLARARSAPEEDMEPLMHTTLRHSLNLSRSALHLLKPSFYTTIVENILYLGMPAVEGSVFSGRWNKDKNTAEYLTDRRTV